jgi:hypothetical protein
MESYWTTRALVAGTTLILVAAGQAQECTVTSTYAGCDFQHGSMFVLKAGAALTIDTFDVHFEDLYNPAPCGSSCSVTQVEVYYKAGTYKGYENDPSAWTLHGAIAHTVTTGLGVPQPFGLPLSLPMDPGGVAKLSFYVTNTGHWGTNECVRTTYGKNEYTAPGLTLKSGSGNIYPFGQIFDTRTWNGSVHYTLGGGVGGVAYCTAGTSGSGCRASLSAFGTASATAASGFTLIASNVEGEKDGLFFFGANGRQANPWGNGTSFQCVTPPVTRGPLLTGAGQSGACDGTFVEDLNALWCPSCTSPQKNPGSGAIVQAQLWYRDPFSSSNQTTSLSDALEFCVAP